MANRVLADACVLAPRTTRDWLLLLRHLGSGSLFVLLTTEDILAETIRAVRRMNAHLEGTHLTRVREKLDTIIDIRVTEYGHGQDMKAITDEYDRHVHAAAVDGHAHILVTEDKGFLNLPETVTDTLNYEIYQPDDFFMLVNDADPTLVAEVLKFQIEGRPPTGDGNYDYPEALRSANCPQFADAVQQHLRQLAHRR